MVASRIDETDKPGSGRERSAGLGDSPRTLRRDCGTDQLSGLRLGLMHGRLSGDEKDAVMAAFRSGQIDVLVCTTVIEVGVDVATRR